MVSSAYEWIGQSVMERRSLMNNRKRVGGEKGEDKNAEEELRRKRRV